MVWYAVEKDGKYLEDCGEWGREWSNKLTPFCLLEKVDSHILSLYGGRVVSFEILRRD